jgi:glutaredoxin
VELYQAEWCPHSHNVRQCLTELGLDYVIRQVAADPEARDDLRRRSGTTEIPVLFPDGREAVCGEDEILAYLRRFEPRADAEDHRAKSHEEVPTFAS